MDSRYGGFINDIRFVQFIEDGDLLVIRSYSFRNDGLDFICEEQESAFTINTSKTVLMENGEIPKSEWRRNFGTGKAIIIEKRYPKKQEMMSPQELLDRIICDQTDLMLVVNAGRDLMRYALYWYLSDEDIELYCAYIRNQRRYRIMKETLLTDEEKENQ